MPTYRYQAYDGAGKSLKGSIEAMSLKEARDKLKQAGLFPKELLAMAKGAGPGLFRRKSVSAIELAAMTRELSTLINAGTPLFEALNLLAIETPNKYLAGLLAGVKDAVFGGSSLSRALSAHPDVFSEMYVRSVEAAEAAGTLDKVLDKLSEYLESRARVVEKVRTALVYPVLMTVVGAGVLAFLFIFVIPKITSIFEDTKQALPVSTVILLFIVKAFRYSWPAIPFVIAGLYFGLKSYLKRPGTRERVDAMLLKAPFLGGLLVNFYMANLSRTLGSLLRSGVPILVALDMTKKVLHHGVYGTALSSVMKDVTEGASLSNAMKSTGVFPGVLVHMAATGERSGTLDELLLKAAASYEGNFETGVTRSLSFIEPAMIVAMGVVVGFVVLAILLPIFQLNQVMG